MADQADKLRGLASLMQKADNNTLGKRILAVTSGKGGVGKSNLSVNLSIALANQGYNTLLLDADLGMANVDLLVGITPKFNLQHVLSNQKSMKDIIIEGPSGMRIVPGVSGAMGVSEMTAYQKHRFLVELQQLEIDYPADYILIDTAAGMSENVMNFVLAADEVLVVTTPEPTAMMDAYAIIKTIVKSAQNSEIKVVINMVKSKKEAESTFSTLSVIAKRFLNFEIKLLGYILRDLEVSKSVQKQVPFIIAAPRSSAAQCINSIVAKLTEQEPQSNGIQSIKRFFEKALSSNSMEL